MLSTAKEVSLLGELRSHKLWVQPKKREETSLLILLCCWSRSSPGFDELPVSIHADNLHISIIISKKWTSLIVLSLLCVCVYTYVYVCVCIYTHVYTCIYTYIHIYIILKNYFNISMTTMINQEVKNIKKDGTIFILLYYRLGFISGLMLLGSLPGKTVQWNYLYFPATHFPRIDDVC